MAFTMGLGWYGNGTASKSNVGATQPCGLQRLEQPIVHYGLSRISYLFKRLKKTIQVWLPSLKLTWHLKMDGWKTTFLLFQGG